MDVIDVQFPNKNTRHLPSLQGTSVLMLWLVLPEYINILNGGFLVAIFITFNMVNINSMNTQVGVFVGNNNALGWDANGKLVMGIGQIMGINQAAPLGAYLYADSDIVDQPIIENQIKNGNTLQGM
ncbi:hypothetical protein [Alicyclobacillus dauci]|uniref:Uncharacterized protein n=1 Tax=Alicyclobacillus dauci TaxID=1475485 RepID=A0ABY6Z4M0_9BACL|nr:hypothetical protein [Alicyclobacillus dauci]WAH37229.1 hypothetical protein NZD86_01380 [Alicyclobacillus dauci]